MILPVKHLLFHNLRSKIYHAKVQTNETKHWKRRIHQRPTNRSSVGQSEGPKIVVVDPLNHILRGILTDWHRYTFTKFTIEFLFTFLEFNLSNF